VIGDRREGDTHCKDDLASSPSKLNKCTGSNGGNDSREEEVIYDGRERKTVLDRRAEREQISLLDAERNSLAEALKANSNGEEGSKKLGPGKY